MSRSRSSENRTLTKLAVAGMLLAAPLGGALGLAAQAAANPLIVAPNDPPPDPPAPTVPHGEYYNPTDPNDWYNHSADSGGGGGGG